MNIDDISKTLSEYFSEDTSRLGISVIAENKDSTSKTVHTALYGDPVETGALLAYVMHKDEAFYEIVKGALMAVNEIKKQDAKKSNNS